MNVHATLLASWCSPKHSDDGMWDKAVGSRDNNCTVLAKGSPHVVVDVYNSASKQGPLSSAHHNWLAIRGLDRHV